MPQLQDVVGQTGGQQPLLGEDGLHLGVGGQHEVLEVGAEPGGQGGLALLPLLEIPERAVNGPSRRLTTYNARSFSLLKVPLF